VFHTRIDLLIDDRKADLETLRNRTSPWRAIVQEALEDLQSRGLHERIERIKGAGEERNDGDMLSILERYSEHIENELRQQIATLKAQLAEQRFKKACGCDVSFRGERDGADPAVSFAFFGIFALLFALWLNHRFSSYPRRKAAAE
jgi:hypothetical protein